DSRTSTHELSITVRKYKVDLTPKKLAYLRSLGLTHVYEGTPTCFEGQAIWMDEWVSKTGKCSLFVHYYKEGDALCRLHYTQVGGIEAFILKNLIKEMTRLGWT
ncbi:hypothetical protein CEW46_31225, partial [Bacillus cereus]